MLSYTDRLPAWSLAVGAMLSVQLGAAMSVGLFDQVGVAGTAWLRLSFGAIGIWLIARPRLNRWSPAELRAPLLLGIVMAGMNLCFVSAINRLPLGTAVAIEFLGPLTLAAFHTKSRRALVWPLFALVGVLLVTEPWTGYFNAVGVGFALAAAVGWALFVIGTQHIGDNFSGLNGLSISLIVAALASSVIGLPEAWGNLNAQTLATAIAAAVLLPMIPWSLELQALRRLTKSAYGTLMAVEPGVALLIGAIALRQAPTVTQAVGIGCVALAGVAAARQAPRTESA